MLASLSWTRRNPKTTLNIARLRLLSSEVQSSSYANPQVYLGTLDPSKLDHQDFVDMSNKAHLKLRVKHSSQNIFIKHSFLTNAQGFLYYNVPPPHLPPIMGDLRFRITSSSDPSSFNDGSDLLHATRPIPWSLPLLHLVKTNKFPICEQLVAENLISQELLDRCQLIWKNSSGATPLYTRRIRSFLYHLDQPIFFPFDHRANTTRIWVVGKEKLSLCTARHPLRCRDGARLTGSGLVRFEKLDDESLGIRLLKIIEPPQMIKDSPLGRRRSLNIPVEGELVRRGGEIFKVTVGSEDTSALRELL